MGDPPTDVNLVDLGRVNISEIDFTNTDLRVDGNYVFYYTHLTRYNISFNIKMLTFYKISCKDYSALG